MRGVSAPILLCLLHFRVKKIVSSNIMFFFCCLIFNKTSLEDLGAANFIDHKVLQKSSTVVASVTDRQTDRQTNIWTSRAAVAAKNLRFHK